MACRTPSPGTSSACPCSAWRGPPLPARGRSADATIRRSFAGVRARSGHGQDCRGYAVAPSAPWSSASNRRRRSLRRLVELMPCGDGGDVGGLGGGDSGDDVGSVRPRAQAEGRIGGGGRRQKLRALRRGLSVLEKAIARGRVLVYAGHYSIPSICPASAGHFFVVANCCYRASRSCPRCCVALGKNTLEAFAGDAPAAGCTQAITEAALLAHIQNGLRRDVEQPRHLAGRVVVELTVVDHHRSPGYGERPRGA